MYCRSTGDVANAGAAKTRVVFDAALDRNHSADAYYRDRFAWDPDRTLDSHAHARLFGNPSGRGGLDDT